MKTCTVEGCDRKHVAKGMCAKHYYADRRKMHGREPRNERKVEVACTHCGQLTVRAADKRWLPFCDRECQELYALERRTPKPPREPYVAPDLRGPLRKAIEAGDHAGVIAAIQSDCDVRPSGCWEWQRTLHPSGYASVRVGKRKQFVHRLSLEARLGRPLGKQAAHHVCANSFCVNPDHLQPVTAAANTAEMMGRTYMLGRIAELEQALRLIDPTHPMLDEISTSLVA